MPENYKKDLLLKLVENYRKSKKDRGAEKINRRTQIKPSALYREYSKPNGDPDKIAAINEAAEYYREKGFIFYEQKKYSTEISVIYLNDEKITEAEAYLAEQFQYVSKDTKLKRIQELIEQYDGQTPIVSAECGKLRTCLAGRKLPSDYGNKKEDNYQKTEDVFRALVFIEKNQEMLYLREASMKIYGSSKYFEENTLGTVCSLIREYRQQPCQENELADEILLEYGILKEEPTLCIKGCVTIGIGGKELNLSLLPGGMEFCAKDLEKLDYIKVRDQRLVTVENKTSYYRCQERDTAYFYLGGYANRFQREFLKTVYRDNLSIEYLHFGDIDAGGFFIHENLCNATGIPFALYHMSAEELKNPAYDKGLQPLTDNDRKRLETLQQKDLYKETVTYMLEHNVKLEQEVIRLI